ncbi:S-adenosyl-L-methionine-dependent methyltransferase [Massarina eburnea CBS 473.64]|uniref:S-adenosyl-L-methionine-dependent methyltransferase n=1 Tax=Massarina eburnea CBS 473.64 TaxID=1395130 RepID=A0A6A6RGJ1_9PLEO|nr:S-adenosyl-L-methionine-dependent methyltransferase [Massarina eburnea CBS 473.64]
MSSTTPAPSQNQDRLRAHFAGHAIPTHSARWDTLWATADFLPWDRGHANPALIDALRQRSDLFPPTLPPNTSSQTHTKRKRALVPGCGKGYDVALFAAHGYDAYGLEVSEHAARAAREYLKEPGPGPLEGEYEVGGVGEGKREVVEGDYFEDSWLSDVEGGKGEGFDIIYDNTFLCALEPSLRPRWAARTAQLLAPDGILVCLEFPTHKPSSSGGPPYSIPPLVHEELFKRPGDEITYDEVGKVVKTEREQSADALVKVAHWTPERTVKVGIVNGVIMDRVSVWRHQSK